MKPEYSCLYHDQIFKLEFKLWKSPSGKQEQAQAVGQKEINIQKKKNLSEDWFVKATYSIEVDQTKKKGNIFGLYIPH